MIAQNLLPKFRIQRYEYKQRCRNHGNDGWLQFEHFFVQHKGFWIDARTRKAHAHHHKHRKEERPAHVDKKRNFVFAFAVFKGRKQNVFVTEQRHRKAVKKDGHTKAGEASPQRLLRRWCASKTYQG